MMRSILVVGALFYIPASLALTLNGTTEFAEVVELNAATAGLVRSVRVQAGEYVKHGQLLIELDDTVQRSRLQQAEANVKALKPAVETAQQELTRAEELYARDSLSQIELDRTANTLSLAEGRYEEAEAGSALASYELDHTRIMSPFDSVVLQLQTHVQAYVNPAVEKSVLITLARTDAMKAVALLNSDQWSPGLMNKKATVRYQNKTFSGVVSYLGFNRIKSNSGSTGYELQVRFSTKAKIPAGMPVTVEITE